MVIFLTINGDEFQTPGNRVEYRPQEKLGSEALFTVTQEGDWHLTAQVRACEVIGWHIVPELEVEPEG